MRKIALFGISILFGLMCILPVYADQLTNAQKEKSSIDSQLKDVNKQKQEVLTQKKKLENQEKSLQGAVQQESREYGDLLNEAAALESEIKKMDQAVKESEELYVKQKELLKTRLRAMSDSSTTSVLETLIRAKSFTDFFNRLELITLISRKDKQIMEDMRIAKLEVENKKQLKDEQKAGVIQKVGEKQDRINQINVSRSDLQDKIRKSEADLNKLESREDALYQKSKEMDSLIKNLARSTKKYIGGNMQWPAPGNTNVSSPYGMRYHPILKKNKMHTGIDIDANKGDPVVAANNGTVIMASYQSGYGNTVVIDHGGGITTLYAHTSKILVKVGDEVKAGDTIALVGSTGLSTGPHLHFEVRKDGETRDPLDPL